MSQTQTFLYHSSHSVGGLAKYAQHQLDALEKAMTPGQVVLHGKPEALDSHQDAHQKTPNVLTRALRFYKSATDPIQSLDQKIAELKPRWVLLNSWSEYFAPFWAPKLRKWQQSGVRFGAVIHDPVRDFVRGPQWWHQWSVREAYSFLDIAFTHDDTPLDLGGSQKHIERVSIPHGPYELPVPQKPQSKHALRNALSIPSDCFLLLSFGHLRDTKNLDLLLRALTHHPDTHILVAGQVLTQGQKTMKDYQGLASQLGISHRCHWVDGYVPEDAAWKYFAMSDAVALTYSSSFRSASGVLNMNAQFRKPVLASCGESPLKDAVETYGLGPWVRPDSEAAISDGLKKLRATPEWTAARWEDYLEQNSWSENARRVMKAFEEVGS